MKRWNTISEEERNLIKAKCVERGNKPPRPTAISHAKSALTRTGKHIHNDRHRKHLSEAAKSPDHPFNRQGVIELRKQTWDFINRGRGEKNGRAVFANIFDPSGLIVGSGYLREVCASLGMPFNTMLLACRHGKPLQRGALKGWMVIKCIKPTCIGQQLFN